MSLASQRRRVDGTLRPKTVRSRKAHAHVLLDRLPDDMNSPACRLFEWAVWGLIRACHYSDVSTAHKETT